jgi:hypothetical protein
MIEMDDNWRTELEKAQEENARLRAELAAKEQQNEGGRIFCGDLLNRIAAKDALLKEARISIEHEASQECIRTHDGLELSSGNCWVCQKIKRHKELLAKLDAEGVKG